MIICPVCEHQQALGTECEVCGKQLAAPREAPLPVARLPELEQTAVVNSRIAVPVTPMSELELNAMAAVPEVPGVPMPELDFGRAAQVSVPVETMSELEQHREAEDPLGMTLLPTGPLTCRYCRHVQAEGAVCDRCGMRLPRYVPSVTAQPGLAAGEEVPIIRHGCGVKTRANAPCSSCGVFVPLPSE